MQDAQDLNQRLAIHQYMAVFAYSTGKFQGLQVFFEGPPKQLSWPEIVQQLL